MRPSLRIFRLRHLLFLALLLESLTLWIWSKTPYFRVPIPDSDAALYWFLSRVIKKEGLLFGSYPLFFSPFFAYVYYFLSLLGNPITLVILLNAFLYPLTLFLTVKLASRIFDPEVGILAGLFYLLTGVLLFYALLPIKTMLFLFLALLFFYLFEREKFFGAGVVGSLAVELEGLFLPLLVICALWAGIKGGLRRIFWFGLGFLITASPFLALGYFKTGHLSLTASSSGIHFYIGNWEKARGIYTLVPGIRPNAFGHYYDTLRLARKLSGKKLSPQEANLFWWQKGFAEIKAHPGRFLKLYLKKLLLIFNSYEVPNNYNFEYLRGRLWPLWFLPFTLALWFPLGLCGYFLGLFQKKSFRGLDFVLWFYPFVLALFFVASRYRVIIYFPLLIYSAFFLKHLKEIVGLESRFKFFFLATFFLAYSLSNWPLIGRARCNFWRAYQVKEKETIYLYYLEKKPETPFKKKLEASLFRSTQMSEIANFILKTSGSES